jgi:hypothetical protein
MTLSSSQTARPLTDRIGQGRAVRRHIGHQHIVHIGPVVDDENDRRVGINGAERPILGVPQPHVIDEFRQPFRGACAEAEIGEQRQRRHNLACVGFGPPQHDRARRIRRPRFRLDRFQDLRIEHQPLDLRLPFGQAERLDAGIESLVEFTDGEVQPPPHKPAHRRPENAIEQADEGEDDEQDDQPEGK